MEFATPIDKYNDENATMGTPGSAVILTAFGNVSCKDNGLAASFYSISALIRQIRVLFLNIRENP